MPDDKPEDQSPVTNPYPDPYSSRPTILPGTGSGAAATVTISEGKVTSITITDGGGHGHVVGSDESADPASFLSDEPEPTEEVETWRDRPPLLL